MQLFDKKSSCFGCGACQERCAVGAIRMEPDREGFWYPVVDPEKCVHCSSCISVCPGTHMPSGTEGQAYALRCKNQELLYRSSSGGAFSLLAEQTIRQGGVVCGAVFDSDFQVRHILSENIAPMRKSKYVQSDLRFCYAQIREALDQGKKVLFTGTPCQCDAVRLCFPDDLDQLVFAALICRGVLSPGLWKDYANYIAQDGSLEAYCFRDKRLKNDAHTIAYTTGGTEHTVTMGQDPFSRIYMKCIALRPSCYQCPYTRWELPFDLTIGDFWGIEKSYPDMADGMGTSLVIARTEKGRKLLDDLRDQAILRKSTRSAADQAALKEPARETILRKLLFQDFARKDSSGNSNIPLILKKYGG